MNNDDNNTNAFTILTYFILGISIFLLSQMMIDSTNPCSQFSDQPELCHSDNHPGG